MQTENSKNPGKMFMSIHTTALNYGDRSTWFSCCLLSLQDGIQGKHLLRVQNVSCTLCKRGEWATETGKCLQVNFALPVAENEPAVLSNEDFGEYIFL